MTYKLIKEYVETVIDKQSTHIGVKGYDPQQGIVVGDLLIERFDDSEQWYDVIAGDRYYPMTILTEGERQGL